MNVIQIAGHLGSDPTTRFTSSGLKVTSFTVAVNIRKGETAVTNWYRVTIWGERFDKMLPYLKKGSAVIVVGELRAEIYTDKEGRPQIGLEVTAEMIRFSPFGKPGQEGQTQGQQSKPAAGYNTGSSNRDSGFGEHTFQGSAQGSGPQGAPEEDQLPF